MRPRHDDPEIAEDVKAAQLPIGARVELKTLAKDNADDVARHLVMVARLIDTDPQLAHRHAISAGRRAGRIAVVRETLGITSYEIGDFAGALRELRTYRRISGRDDQLPLMVDSERGLGRPERALELGRSVDRATLPADVQAMLAIAMSGARLDLGDVEAALIELEVPQLDPDRAFTYSPPLFRAYAEVLAELGRDEEAAEWRRRADIADEALDSAEIEAAGGETIEITEIELSADELDGELSADEPGADEPGADEPGADEPGADEPGADETNAAEDQAGGGIAEEPTEHDVDADEVGADQAPTDQAPTDDPAADQESADDAASGNAQA